MITTPLDERETTVYRLFNASNVLLYVGVSCNPLARIPSHQDKPWWPQVARSTTEQHPDRITALRIEATAIVEEKPLYNVVGVDPERVSVRPPRPRQAEPRDHSGRTLTQAMRAAGLRPWGAASNLSEAQQRVAARAWLRWKREAGES